MDRTRAQKVLFMGLNDELRFGFAAGLTWDEAIQTLKDKVAQLEQLRDRKLDPHDRGVLR